jgi:hypothetical protein
MSQLPVDCLNDILEYLKDDMISCILVNHLLGFSENFLEQYPKLLYYNRLSSKRFKRNFMQDWI